MTAERSGSSPPLVGSALRIFDLSLGQMLWSRRSVLLALLAGSPVLMSMAIRAVTIVHPLPQINGSRVGGPALFGMMIWLLYIRVIVPVLGVFYGTALIADEIDDKTITYLFTRPVPRSAVSAKHRFCVHHPAGPAVGRGGVFPHRPAQRRQHRRRFRSFWQTSGYWRLD